VVDGPEATLAQVSTLLATSELPPDVLTDVHGGLRTAVAQVRSIARGLSPPALAEEGLAAGFDELAGRVECRLRVRGVPLRRLPPAIELTCYLTVADAATRALGLLTVELTDEPTPPQLVCRIEGAAGPPETSVVDRIHAVGGTIDMSATSVSVTLPLPEIAESR
jgi:hypothetical protein